MAYVPEFVRLELQGYQPLAMAPGREHDVEAEQHLLAAQPPATSSSAPPFSLKSSGITAASVLVGLFVGALLSFSNMYFGLQTGWVTMGSLQSALLGYGICRVLRISPFTSAHHVIMQTTAVAAATLPLAGGFVSVLPALAMLDHPFRLTGGQLWLWSLAVAFFGVFFAVPLRAQLILREQLRFPSGTATAEMIRVLQQHTREVQRRRASFSAPQPLTYAHHTVLSEGDRTALLAGPPDHHVQEEDTQGRLLNRSPSSGMTNRRPSTATSTERTEAEERQDMFADTTQRDVGMANDEPSAVPMNNTRQQWRLLLVSFGLSGFYEFLSYFLPVLKHIPLLGTGVAFEWGWSLTPSPSYIGQGMIMGMRVAASQMAGALFAWTLVGPLVRQAGWAPGPISDSNTGVAGWLVWFSLAIILGESLASLAVVLVRTVRAMQRHRRGAQAAASETAGHPSHQVPGWLWQSGLAVSTVLCSVICAVLFSMPWYEPAVAVILAMLVAFLAIRALGQTDLNPVSGVGKLSQLAFGGVSPGNPVASLVAGGLAEAAAMQAGDMMQDLKTGYLLHASPRGQFYAQLFGSAASIFIAIAAWELYNSAYTIPGPEFAVPSAHLWLNMARALSGARLPPHLLPFCIVGGVVAGAVPVVEAVWPATEHYMPSAVAFGIGMYLSPYWSIPRFLGAVIACVWQKRQPAQYSSLMIVVASGLVLGEGLLSIVAALFTSQKVPIWSCAGCQPGFCPSQCFDSPS